MKMVDKSLLQILEGQVPLLNSVISLLDSKEINKKKVRQLLEYLRQDIKAHLRDLQEGSTMTQEPDGLESAVGNQLQGQGSYNWNQIMDLDKRLSKLESWKESLMDDGK